MATFLDMVQELHGLAGGGGNPPNRIDNLSGEYSRLVRFVADAEIEIQNWWANWNFLWTQTTSGFHVTANGRTQPPEDLATWDDTGLFIREGTTYDWEPINVRDYNDDRGFLNTGDTGYPATAYILPDNSLLFDPTPDRDYPFLADYWKRPVRLTEADQVTPIPDAFTRTVVVGNALIYFGAYDDAPELQRYGQRLVDENRSQLENSQLPIDKSAWIMGRGFEVQTER